MMNQRPPMQGIANQMAQHGRYGDSMLVHMNPIEVQGIAALSPTGSLTTNPVTGQPEAFLPFLAPLLGSFLGSTFLTGSTLGVLGSGLSSAAAGAIGSGLATTAATGDLKKGILSGLTGYGVGQALGAASDALNPEIVNLEGALEGAGDAVGAVDTAAQTGAELAGAQAELAAMPDLAATADVSMAVPPSDATMAGGDFFGATRPGGVDPAYLSKMEEVQKLQSQFAGQQAKIGELKSSLAAERAALTPMERAAAPFANPGTFGKALIKPTNLAAIGVGEGQRGAIEMEERFARDAKRFQDERDAELERARQGMRSAYSQLESDYPGYKIPGYQAGGITSVNPNNYMSNLRGLQALAGGGRTVQNFNRGGRTASDDYNDYMGTRPIFGAGTAAQRQANIRGSQVISPEQLQGYRPGFGPEINYFQRPSQTTPPGTVPGTGPGTVPGDGPPGGPGRDPGMSLPPGDISGGPGKGGTMGGIADFDYSQFAESEAGREAIANFRDLTGISDVTNRLSAIETRPDPTIPQIDYDEITNRVRGGIDIPEFDLSGIESRLGAIETRDIPTIDYDAITNRVREGINIPEYTAPSIDYDAITQRVREGIDIPTYDTSGIMDAIAANREAIAGMPAPSSVDYDEIANRVRGSIDIPAVDLSGIETRLGAIEGREMPTFDTSGIMSAIDANRQAISGIPSVDLSGIEGRLGAIEGREMPTFDTSGLMSAIDANRQAIAGMPAVDLSGIETRLGAIEGREMPTFDTSGIMSAIDANRQAIAGLPAPTPAFDSSGIMDAIAANREAISGMPAPAPAFDAGEILAAIEANRKAIGGINSGGINPNPTAGIPTAPVKQAPVKSSPIRMPKGFAEGGETEMSADQGSRIIDLAIAAVMGQLPEDQAESVINRFVDEFGSEAFAILRRQVLQGNVPGAQTEGKINGNGGGMDDKVPGMIGDQQPVAVSPGEFIVPADVVSGLGDGSTDAGVEELHGMMDRVRSERTGMKQQPRPVNKAKVMPV